MNKRISSILIIALLMTGVIACKPKKCANFQDPRRSYKARYDKKGHVKTKNKNRNSGTWSDKY